MSTMLHNTQPLTLDGSGKTEIVRIYEVTIHKPGLVWADGTDVNYITQVSLRYTHEKAANRDPNGYDAHAEAGRRAIKLERAGFHTPIDRELHVDPTVDVTFIRETEKAARA